MQNKRYTNTHIFISILLILLRFKSITYYVYKICVAILKIPHLLYTRKSFYLIVLRYNYDHVFTHHFEGL